MRIEKIEEKKEERNIIEIMEDVRILHNGESFILEKGDKIEVLPKISKQVEMTRKDAIAFVKKSYSKYFTYGIEGSDLGTPVSKKDAIADLENMSDDEWNGDGSETPKVYATDSKGKIKESMLPSRMVSDYEMRAEAERRSGSTIEIDTRIPYVSVEFSDGSEYFFEDEEAEDLLDEVPDNISAEDYILAMAQGW